jgi:hypothetical protein
MVATIIKKIVQQAPKTVKKIIKSKRKKLFPLEIKPGKKKVDPKSPFAHVDELGARPLHRGAGPSGVQKKKLKEAGERISKWFRKQEGKGPVREQDTLPGLKKGGLIRGFPKIAKKGWR